MTDEIPGSTDPTIPDPADDTTVEPVLASPAAPDVAPEPPPVVAAPVVPPPVVAPPPPPVGWQAPPAVVAVKGQRTGLALGAGILLILGGIGGILLGLAVALIGGSVASNFDFSRFSNSTDLNGVDPGSIAGGVVAFFGAVVVAYSIAYLLAGIAVVRNANWGRVLGIILGIISGLIWLSGLSSANSAGTATSAASGGLFSIVAVAIHVYIVVALLFFWRSKPTAVA
jgi:hypothetical protein